MVPRTSSIWPKLDIPVDTISGKTGWSWNNWTYWNVWGKRVAGGPGIEPGFTEPKSQTTSKRLIVTECHRVAYFLDLEQFLCSRCVIECDRDRSRIGSKTGIRGNPYFPAANSFAFSSKNADRPSPKKPLSSLRNMDLFTNVAEFWRKPFSATRGFSWFSCDRGAHFS